MGPSSGSRPAGFRGAFYALLPQIRTATPTLMREMRELAFFNSGIVPVGNAQRKLMRNRRISLRRLCFAEFYQHNPSDFCTVLSDPEYQARHYATAQTALGGEHFCCRNLRFK